ncbi:MAG: DEAD/DEAH box helicase family protein [Elusimicrobiota bacterium]
MASKIIAAGLSFWLAFFPVANAAFAASFDAPAEGLNAQNISGVNLSLDQVNQLISILQSGNSGGPGSPFSANLSSEDLGQMVEYLQKIKAYYGRSGKVLPRPVAQRLQNLSRQIQNGSVDPNLAFADFYSGTASYVEAAEAQNTVSKVVSQSRREVDVKRIDQATGQVVGYIRSIQETPITRLVFMSLPDAQASGGQTIDLIAFVSQEGAAQIQHPLYSRRMEILLKDLVKMYYQQPQLQAQIDKASGAAKTKLSALLNVNRDKFPPQILAYVKKLTQWESEKGGLTEHSWSAADYDAFESVAQAAQNFYAKQQANGLAKRALAIFTSYIAMATDSNPAQEKDGLEQGGLDAQPAALLQKALSQFESGKLSGYKTVLSSWLHDTRVNYADWPAEMSQQASEIVADIGYAAANGGKAFEHAGDAGETGKQGALEREDEKAALEARNGWTNLANLQVLSFQMKLMAIALAKLKNGDMSGHLGLSGDAGMQAEASKLIETVGQYLSQLKDAVANAHAILMKQAVAGFYLTLQNAQMDYLYGGALEQKVSDLAAKIKEIKELYLAEEFAKDEAVLGKGSELDAMKGDPYKLFLSHLPPKAAAMAAALDALYARLAAVSKMSDAKAVRANLWPIWKQFSALAAQLGFSSIPDQAQVGKEAQAASLRQTKLSQAAQEFASRMDLFERANQTNLLLLENASVQKVPSADDHWYSKLIPTVENWVVAKASFGHAGYDTIVNKGVEHGGGALMAKMMRVAGDNVYWKPEVFKNFVEKSQLRNQLLSQLRIGDFDAAEKTLSQIAPDEADKAWNLQQKEKAPQNNLYNLDLSQFLLHAPESQTMVKAQGVMQTIQEQLKPIILAYQLTSAVVDTAVMTFMTAGFGAVAGGALKFLGEGAIAAARGIDAGAEVSDVGSGAEAAAEAAEASSEIANVGRDTEEAGALRGALSNTLNFVGRHLDSWGTGIKNAVGLSDVSNGASKAVVVRQALQKTLTMNLKTEAMMTGISSAISTLDYWRHPATSNAQNMGDAALSGAVGGLSFGAKSGPLFLMMPQASAFGGGWFGQSVRAVADSPGPLSSTLNFLAKAVPGAADSSVGESLVDKGLWGSIGDLGADNSLLKTLAGNAAHFGAMADGTAKYMIANSLAENGAQFISYEMHAHGTPSKAETAKFKEEGTSQRLYALRSALSAGNAAGQVSWFFVPQNTIASSKDSERQADQSAALTQMLREDRGLEIEMATKDEPLYVDKPWAQRTWRERAKNALEVLTRPDHKAVAPRLELRVDETAHEAAAVRRMKDFSGADLLAVMSAPRDEVRGRVLKLSDLKNQLGGKDGESTPYESLAAQERVDAQSVRLSDEIQESARSRLKKWLRKNPDEISRIREAKDDGDYLMPDGKGGTVAVRGEALKNLKNIAALETIALGAEPQTFSEKTNAFLSRIKDALTGREVKGRYQTLISDLRTQIHGNTAEEIISSTREALQKKIDERKAKSKTNDAWALEHVRSTVESDAYINYINRKFFTDAKRYKAGNMTEKEMDQSVALFRDVWEQGVFGQRFHKSVNEKGESVWNIPREYQFKDAHGHMVTSFRDFQVDALESVLKDIASGRKRVFRLLETGGGKTLLSFVYLSLLDTMAKMSGRQGAIYATSNGNLVAQANEAYRAFFKGREPPFKIETYEQLMLDQAMAKALGRLSPYQTHYVVNDEYDQLGTQTALSLGSPNGRLSFPEIDPIQQAVREGSFKSRNELQKEFGGTDLDGKSVDEMIRNNPDLAAKLDRLKQETTRNVETAIQKVKSGEFKKQVLDIHSELYAKAHAEGRLPEFSSLADYEVYFHMSPDQVYKTMRQEMKHAFGGNALPPAVRRLLRMTSGEITLPESLQKILHTKTMPIGLPIPLDAFVKIGVIERQFHSLSDWVNYNLKGAYIVGSFSPEKLSQIYARGEDVDPNRPKDLLQYHADVPMANLDTEYRGALQLMEYKPMELNYDNMAVVDFAALNAAAKEGKGVVLALSGTLPEPAREFLGKQGWKVSGKGSAPAAVDYEVARPGLARNVLADRILDDAKINQAGTEKILHVVFISNKAAQKAVETTLDAQGVPADRRSVVVTPDSNMQIHERLMYHVANAKNLKALSKGNVDVVEIVGQSGIRGLDIDFGGYAGGRIEFDILDPQNLSVTNLIQLVGRAAKGRLPKDAQGNPDISVNFNGIIDAKDLPEPLQKMEGTPEFADALQKYINESQSKAEERALKSSGIYDYKPPRLPKALRFLQKKKRLFKAPVSAGPS